MADEVKKPGGDQRGSRLSRSCDQLGLKRGAGRGIKERGERMCVRQEGSGQGQGGSTGEETFLV